MTDRHINFNDAMMNGLLAGRKTLTRRILKNNQSRWEVGDRLWVRERVKLLRGKLSTDGDATNEINEYLVSYDADGKTVLWLTDETLKIFSKSFIGTPRWASRCTCIVTKISIEPLRAITNDDAIQEGIFKIAAGKWTHAPEAETHASPVAAFRALWNQINSEEGANWKANPTVAAISFDVVNQHIDDIR